jgi:flavin-dependent dehydrogenase
MTTSIRSAVALAVLAAALSAPAADLVRSPARELPVLHDVDVVVVGGASAGVAAAAEAAKAGAKVFLATPHPYLGDDLCATYRLWLEPGETPRGEMAKALFAGEPERPEGKGLELTYSADLKPSAKHADTQPPSRLADGKMENAAKDSVQYDGRVTLVADLGARRKIARASVKAYQRPHEFVVGAVGISVSDDGKTWSEPVVAENPDPGSGREDSAIDIGADLAVETRYVRFAVRPGKDITRILLAELVVEGAPEPGAAPAAVAPAVARPLHVKKTLDEVLINAGVPFLFHCHVVDVLRDARGNLAGVVIANRSGRQAVRAKVVIDATPRATVARMAGAGFRPFPAGTHVFRRAVIGGEPVSKSGVSPVARAARPVVRDEEARRVQVIEYDLAIPMKDGSFASFAEAEQVARDGTWTPDLKDSSDTLFLVPPDPMISLAPASGVWPGAEKASLGALRPKGQDRLWVLGGCADVSRESAVAMLRPHEFLELGARVGREVAAEAKALPAVTAASVVAAAPAPAGGPEVMDQPAAANPRLAGLPVVKEADRGLPVEAEYDVVVVGGGTGGAPAGIGAARQGAKTLVIESIFGLGGVGTWGQIASYYHGYRMGFCAEIDKGVLAIGGVTNGTGHKWNVEHKSEWLRREVRKAGGDIWFGTVGCGALVEKGVVRGVVVATPQGRIVVRAKVVIDGTGNSDVAAAAGAECTYTDEAEIAVQGTGLPPRSLARQYINTDYTFVDETDIFDIWRAFVVGRELFGKAYDQGRLIDTRERRRIIGDVILTPTDMFLGRTWPDTIALAQSNFDSHGYTIHPIFSLRPPDKSSMTVNVPYRALLPRGIDRLLVIGLGISAHRDSVPILRMQPDIQNHGYAAGVAAAWMAAKNLASRAIDIRALQRHMVEMGIVPDRVLADEDNLPLPDDRVQWAVNALPEDWAGLEIVIAHTNAAIPKLRAALAKTGDGAAKLVYAQTLGMLGDPAGAEILASAVRQGDLSGGWDFKAMGQFGPNLTPTDSMMIALGRTRSPVALDPLLEKADLLDGSVVFSHHRAVALALEALGDPRAAPVLAEVLKKPGMSGHALTRIGDAKAKKFAGGTDTQVRRDALREIGLARALYRCGDHERLGESILKAYSADLHGHYARHAQAVLAKGKPGK